MDIERRFITAGRIELRKTAPTADAPALVTIQGYGAVFNCLSDNLGGFREQIAPGAFDGVLGDDVRCFFNHESDLILGRSVAGTLRLSVDDTGLAYECDLPDTQAARDLAVSMARGDVTQSSFAFRCAAGGDTWDENDDGVIIRTLTKIGRLYDVSPVSIPAYPDATSAVRSLSAWQSTRKAAPDALQRAADARRRKLVLHRL
jgi:HK97 family phage prohead protease